MEKTYEPNLHEDKIYKLWEESGFFNPDVCVANGVTKKNVKPFSIVLPPPNVTGTLHIGHAAMLAIQDTMVRYHRMKGDKTLWLPGTDHAAIATQTKVEKLLMQKGMKDPKKELGREKFLAEVNKFAQESHDIIINQCKKMGSSLDWSREAFTLDEKRNLAVRTVFKKMHDDGLIYRGYRIVNWCPRCHSTLADDEVEYKEQKAKLYTFKYRPDFPFAISTTRPETKLGDTAVAVNPKDKRYKKYIGKILEVKKFAGGPDLKLRIIGDNSVDMNFGTGAVGVTPAHSHVDYEMAQKNNLEIIKVIDEDGKMTEKAGEEYAGLGVLEARNKVIERLIDNKSLDDQETMSSFQNNLSVCYRCSTAVEPLPSKQWFIDVNKKVKVKAKKLKVVKDGETYSLKELMQKTVKSGQIQIIPERFNKTYFHWIDNLRDWCISRQIWYGHRIPVWYRSANAHGESEEVYVGIESPKGDGWKQDSDTLDTWFSAGLWTFSTLGWPEKTIDLKTFHPTIVMETGYDILFFWVARMILMTTYTLGEIPFEIVYLHGLVRDEQGRKMSKSLGNVIDPLDTIKKYGADATRLSLIIGNTSGNDLKLNEEKVAGFRNFANKLWNIARFVTTVIASPDSIGAKQSSDQTTRLPRHKVYTELNEVFLAPHNDSELTLSDKWILSRLNETIKTVTENIEKFNFSYAGEVLRDFTWNELADWYLEIAKIEGEKDAILNYILETILKLWHPFMPFVTEAIWKEKEKVKSEKDLLMVSEWPSVIASSKSVAIQLNNFNLIRDIITGIRSLRADYKIDPVKKLKVVISAGKKQKLIEENEKVIIGLARLEETKIKTEIEKPEGSVGFVVGDVEVFVDLSGVVDLEKEKLRLKNEIENLEKYLKGLEMKLSNDSFVKNAPKEVVEKEKDKLTETKDKLEKLNSQLKAL